MAHSFLHRLFPGPLFGPAPLTTRLFVASQSLLSQTPSPEFLASSARAEVESQLQATAEFLPLAAFGGGGLVARGATMGFFSRLISGAGKILGGILGIGGATAAAVPRIATRAAPLARRIGGVVIPGAVAGGAFALGEAALAGTGLQRAQVGPGAAMVGGNGERTTFTTVTTVLNATGEIIASRQLRGSPFLMNVDLVTFKRVGRSLRKGARRAGVRAPRQSTTAFLTEQIQEQALKRALFGQLCPTGSSHENKS